MTHTLRAWAINQRGKNLVRNLQYGPRTQLVRGIYCSENSEGLITQTPDGQDQYQRTLFPTAIVLPSGLQHMLIFSPLVFTTDTHLLAVKRNYNKRVFIYSSAY